MSAETYSPSSFETESEMLPQDPPPKVIRFMGWWLIWLFISALLAAIFVHLPETEHAAFVLIPREGADPIQSPRLATVKTAAEAVRLASRAAGCNADIAQASHSPDAAAHPAGNANTAARLDRSRHVAPGKTAQPPTNKCFAAHQFSRGHFFAVATWKRKSASRSRVSSCIAARWFMDVRARAPSEGNRGISRLALKLGLA
jgi:hypothetical protein